MPPPLRYCHVEYIEQKTIKTYMFIIVIAFHWSMTKRKVTRIVLEDRISDLTLESSSKTGTIMILRYVKSQSSNIVHIHKLIILKKDIF